MTASVYPQWPGRLTRTAVSLGVLFTLAASAQAANPELAGTWRIERPVFAARTAEGKSPPLRPEAAKLYAERQAARKAGDTSFDSATWCASVGLPRMLFIDAPFEIVVRDSYIAFLHEWNWWARVVYLESALAGIGSAPPPGIGAPPGPGTPPRSGPRGNAGPPPSNGLEPSGPMGLSKGKWEGDTLVVDTDQLSNLTLLDGAGLPRSRNLKLNERVHLRSRNVLEDRIRIDDPEVFTQPWEMVVTYRRQRQATIAEDVCLDRIKTGAPAVRE
jgi:hypothetical protein